MFPAHLRGDDHTERLTALMRLKVTSEHKRAIQLSISMFGNSVEGVSGRGRPLVHSSVLPLLPRLWLKTVRVYKAVCAQLHTLVWWVSTTRCASAPSSVVVASRFLVCRATVPLNAVWTKHQRLPAGGASLATVWVTSSEQSSLSGASPLTSDSRPPPGLLPRPHVL